MRESPAGPKEEQKSTEKNGYSGPFRRVYRSTKVGGRRADVGAAESELEEQNRDKIKKIEIKIRAVAPGEDLWR
jgi:hypothetical protein